MGKLVCYALTVRLTDDDLFGRKKSKSAIQCPEIRNKIEK